jgi:hypothetical protein
MTTMGERSGVGLVELAILEALDARRAWHNRRPVSCLKLLLALGDGIGLARGSANQVLIDQTLPWKLPSPFRPATCVCPSHEDSSTSRTWMRSSWRSIWPGPALASRLGSSQASRLGPVTGRADPSCKRRPRGLRASRFTARGVVIAATRCQPRPLPTMCSRSPVCSSGPKARAARTRNCRRPRGRGIPASHRACPRARSRHHRWR